MAGVVFEVIQPDLEIDRRHAAALPMTRTRNSVRAASGNSVERLGQILAARHELILRSGAVLLPISVDKFGLERRHAGQRSRHPTQVFAPIGFWRQTIDRLENPRELRGTLDAHLIPDLCNGY